MATAAAAAAAAAAATTAGCDEGRTQALGDQFNDGITIVAATHEPSTRRNQFDFTARAVQTAAVAVRSRAVEITPPVAYAASGQVAQWIIADAYVAMAGAATAGSSLSSTSNSSVSVMSSSPIVLATDAMHTNIMSRSLAFLERALGQNAEDEVYADLRYWEDASDALRGDCGGGTLLPLWRFDPDAHSRTRGRSATGVCWNPAYGDLFAVSYGSLDFMRQNGGGSIALFSLKATARPEYVYVLPAGVLCLDFHPRHPALLAIGCYDGTVQVFDVRRRDNKPVLASILASGTHSDPVWDVKWAQGGCSDAQADGTGGDETSELKFFSISSDGRVARWSLAKSELRMEIIVILRASILRQLTRGSGGGGGAPQHARLAPVGAPSTTTTLAPALVGFVATSSVDDVEDAFLPAQVSSAFDSRRGGHHDSSRVAEGSGARNTNAPESGSCIAFHPLDNRVYVALPIVTQKPGDWWRPTTQLVH